MSRGRPPPACRCGKAASFRVGRVADHALPDPPHRPANAEKEVIPSVAPRRDVIADDLRTQISTGRIKTGERLPSEAQLASRYAVSTPTLRSALAVLQGEGLVEKIHGKGNFVRHPLRRITYVGGGRTPLAQTAPDPALRMTVRTTHTPARGHLTALLRVSASSPLTEFLCLSHEGKSPHSLARIYVPRDLAPADGSSESLCCEAALVRLTELRPPLAEVRERVSARCPWRQRSWFFPATAPTRSSPTTR